MMSESSELARIGRSDELLDVIGKYGDRGMEFVWKNKTALATTTVLTAFLANPEPFINGGKELVAEVIESVGEHVGGPIARSINWTLIVLVFGGLAAAWYAMPRFTKKRKKR